MRAQLLALLLATAWLCEASRCRKNVVKSDLSACPYGYLENLVGYCFQDCTLLPQLGASTCQNCTVNCGGEGGYGSLCASTEEACSTAGVSLTDINRCREPGGATLRLPQEVATPTLAYLLDSMYGPKLSKLPLQVMSKGLRLARTFIKQDFLLQGGDLSLISFVDTPSPQECDEQCWKVPMCVAWNWSPNFKQCWMKGPSGWAGEVSLGNVAGVLTKSLGPGWLFDVSTNYSVPSSDLRIGGDILPDSTVITVLQPEHCAAACAAVEACAFWSFNSQDWSCRLQKGVAGAGLTLSMGPGYQSGRMARLRKQTSVADGGMPYCHYEEGIAYVGRQWKYSNGTEASWPAGSAEECCQLCAEYTNSNGESVCWAFTYRSSESQCRLKDALHYAVQGGWQRVAEEGAVAGKLFSRFSLGSL